MKMRNGKELMGIYQTLYQTFGPQCWWPAETPLEVIVGAVLTQNTAWTNVEKAIMNLKRGNNLSITQLYHMPMQALAKLIRPSGYFNLKAKRLKAVIKWLWVSCRGKITELRKRTTPQLRTMLLNIYGIGPETADSILLYALDKKSFVVDAYTKRIFSRHGFIKEDENYDKVKKLFESALPKSRKIYNEYHALIVHVGKDFCRKKPLCNICPLEKDLKLINRHREGARATAAI